MNNKIKIIIALGIIGILIMVAGFVMGSGPSSIPAIFSEQNIPDGAASVKDVQTADIRSIELNLFASKISIKSGESFDLSGSGQFDNYVLNAIVNHANYRYKNPKISEEEMIQNIVFQNYKRNKNQSRSTILMNCLSSLSNKNRFKNHYRINQAVKNINDELEDAQKEFDELFKTDEKEDYL